MAEACLANSRAASSSASRWHVPSSTSPVCWLMDEPFSALDKKLREEMRLETKRLHSDFGVVFVTHDQEEAPTMADRMAVLKGRPRAADRSRTRTLYERPCQACTTLQPPSYGARLRARDPVRRLDAARLRRAIVRFGLLGRQPDVSQWLTRDRQWPSSILQTSTVRMSLA
jgi:energy-coupling factor transporter ATP-binding protein EcfA2